MTAAAPVSSPESMRFLCFGVGAIGAYIGGSLALAGYPVVFVERPTVAEAVRASGLAITLNGETRRLPHPNIADNLEDALNRGPFQAAILAVKSFDTASVLDNVRPFTAEFPPILSFQNGVENEPAITAVLGRERVIPGTVTTAIGRGGPGEVTVERLRGIGVASDHPLSKAILTAAERARLRPKGFSNPAAMKWSKMLTNLLANASSAILDMTPAEIFAHPKLFEMEARQVREALRVMDAMNIPVVDLPATPVRALAWAIRRLPAGLSRPLLIRSVGKGRGAKMPSFHIDLYGGRGKSEVDYLNGAVARAADKYHLPAPVNETLNDLLLRLTSGEIAIDSYAKQPEKLLQAIPDE